MIEVMIRTTISLDADHEQRAGKRVKPDIHPD